MCERTLFVIKIGVWKIVEDTFPSTLVHVLRVTRISFEFYFPFTLKRTITLALFKEEYKSTSFFDLLQ